jgi:tetratricopeptide (TPR) repeat protein
MMGTIRLKILAALCMSLAACKPAATLESARASATDALAAMQHAIALQQEGKVPEAQTEARRGQDGFVLARDQFLSARADQSDDPEVLIEFAQLCERLGDSDLAGEAYLRAANLRADDANLWYRAGRCFVDAGGRYLARAAGPLARAEELARTKPGSVSQAEIEAARGDVSWKSDAYDIAGTRYAAALAADPVNPRGLMGTAKVAIARGAPTEAEAALIELQKSGAAVDPAMVELRLREAYLAYRRARPPLPEDPAAYRALAGIAVRVGFLDEARAATEYALRLKPDDVFSLNMAGSLAHRAGDIERARQAFTRSLELQPDQPRTREALAALPGPGAGLGPLR